MRLAVVADIHGNWTALQAVLERLPGLRVDAVAGAGDYLWTTTGDAAVVDWLRRCEPGWFVRGNGDSMAYYERCRGLAHGDPRPLYAAVAALPERLVLEIEGYRVLLQHEWWPGGDPATLGARLTSAPYVGPEVDLTGIDVAIFGDSHLPLHHALKDRLIVHPGSVGAPFDADPTSAKFAVVDFTPERVRVEHHAVPFNIDAANREIVEGRTKDIGHSYYRKMTEIRRRVAGPAYWAPVPAPVEWRRGEGAVFAPRRATPDDLEFCVQADLRADGEGLSAAASYDGHREKIAWFLSSPDAGAFLVTADRPVGMIMYSVRNRRTGPFYPGEIIQELDEALFPADGRFIDIYQLWVDPAYRRLGLATALKRSLEDVARERGVGLIYTHTEESNAHVIELNRRLGYREVRRGPIWDEHIRVSLIKEVGGADA